MAKFLGIDIDAKKIEQNLIKAGENQEEILKTLKEIDRKMSILVYAAESYVASRK